MATYQLEVVISKQSDRLWRAEVPALQGCFVDSDTIDEAIADIKDVIEMAISARRKRGQPLPKELATLDENDLPIKIVLPVTVG